MLKRLLALSLLLIVVACTQAPQPLRHSRTGFDSTSLRLRDGGTVLIQPIEGTARPLAQIMADSLAQSLAARNIPSTSTPVNNPPYKVRGQAVIKRERHSPKIEGMIYWTFSGQEEAVIHESSQTINVDRHLWELGDQAMIDEIVESAAEKFASYLQDVEEQKVVEQAEHERDVVFKIGKISGAVGDGEAALYKAMQLTLRQAGALVRKQVGPSGYILNAQIDVMPPFEGQQRIKIDWILSDGSGKELGRANQHNQLEEGRLTKPWGRLAYDISKAAMQSIGFMVEKHREEIQFERSRGQPATTAAPGRRNRGLTSPF